MKESDKKKIGEAYLRLHSCNEEEGMTDEEAIKIIKQFRDRQGNSSDDNEALDKAIKLLEQQPFEDILDKIRAEIEALEEGITSYHNDRPWIFKDEVLQIIDKYKAESEVDADDNN